MKVYMWLKVLHIVYTGWEAGFFACFSLSASSNVCRSYFASLLLAVSVGAHWFAAIVLEVATKDLKN